MNAKFKPGEKVRLQPHSLSWASFLATVGLKVGDVAIVVRELDEGYVLYNADWPDGCDEVGQHHVWVDAQDLKRVE